MGGPSVPRGALRARAALSSSPGAGALLPKCFGAWMLGHGYTSSAHWTSRPPRDADSRGSGRTVRRKMAAPAHGLRPIFLALQDTVLWRDHRASFTPIGHLR